MPLTAIDDPHKVVKVIACDGKTAESCELSYSNCKLVGNGSFGVVFQAKLAGVSKEREDIAIKKVLQDKRFKVRVSAPSPDICIPASITAHIHPVVMIESRTSDNETRLPPECG
jgi:hypothetical protein